ncbi:MAG: 50S ribosomal protein L9 [Candidatus Omnitrophica bacterium]|jgi:large subunit ribosomal protein L9|nr:50S ribosomal protein L9 [Candidatus Omnitrophota bacterium]MDD3987506.1 50S ribosomal protein L9 [Candidatus Omnitrophota bacterium]MDD4981231.1 50S ribosomal protein L9 [Candidatus Omnitrophota bacterium]MDD5664740.1 50S ribosomal protein L9 [Candidatus Omnitrophota bacterium]
MKVILTKDVEKIGKAGALMKVKDGFARNFLLPKGFAIEASAGNLKRLKQDQEKMALVLEKKKGVAEELKSRLDNFSLNIPVLVQEDGSLYGSISEVDICAALESEGIEVEKTCVIMEGPIKALGIYEVVLKLHPEVSSKLKIWVVKK